MGEPGGIGPDISLLAWQHCVKNSGPVFALFADAAVLQARAKQLGLSVPIIETSFDKAADVFFKGLPVISLQNSVSASPGKSETKNAAAVIESITRAVEAVQTGAAQAVVTNPAQKATLTKAGFEWPGQTEFLRELDLRHTGVRRRAVMMLASDELKVVPLTIHIALSRVPQAVTRESLIETAQITARALTENFKIARPRLAVAGLNPHAGENGTMGMEDDAILAPAIAVLRGQGMDIRGPLPADTLFHAQARKTYDAAIAMYHDQALIPIKTIAFDSAVNVTLGLSFIRTSPDHGTALDIAGSGKAKPDSLIAALKLAERLTKL